MTIGTLHTKYRPKKLEDVIGQNPVVKAIKQQINGNLSHAFLFTGPAGTGKTTLARIVAKMTGCLPRDILEIDAATNTGIDNMREVQRAGHYKPLGGKSRAIIIDECHRISRQAWDSLLKMVEEPPEHLFWFFCTTEPGKVPKTIMTRCAAFTLKPVRDEDLAKIVDRVIAAEKLDIEKDIRQVVIGEAQGSPRQALVNLGLVLDCQTRKEARDALQSASDSVPAIELCRLMVSGGSWLKAAALVNKLADENPESVRILVVNYIAACLKGATKDRDACHFLSILEQFSTPFNTSENMAPLWLAVGRVIFAGE